MSDATDATDDDALLAQLRALYRQRDDAMRARFDRSLPFADAVLENRWERAGRLGFGEQASIYDSAVVLGEVRVGARTWIGPNVVLDGSGGGLVIGDNCSIAVGVHIYTHDTVLWALSNGAAPYHQAAVAIGDRCHLGAQAVILAGVAIGNQCVVAANATVNRPVAERTVVGGTPARVIGRVEGDGAEVRLVYDR